MAETNVVPTEKPWRDMSDRELALSFVNFQIKTIDQKIKEVDASIEARGLYEAEPAGSLSDLGVGTMDAYDSDVAQIGQNLDGGQEWTEEDKNDFWNELDNWKEDIKIIENGGDDADRMIKAHSALERERREKLETRQSNNPKQLI